MEKCIFCAIINGLKPANILYQNDKIIAFDDLTPKAPQHKLIIPKKHIATVNDILPQDEEIIYNMINTARILAVKLNIDKSGYRILINCNQGGGQVIFHLHLHLLGGWKTDCKI